MSRLDEQLSMRLRQAERPVVTEGLYERVSSRKARADRRRRMASIGLAVVVLAATIGGFLLLSDLFRSGTVPATGARNGLLVYVDGTAGAPHLVVSSATGADAQPLPLGTASAFTPAWSPDGRRIAFAGEARQALGNIDVFVAKPDGTGLVRLTTNPLEDLYPSWSPDGTQIVFSSNDQHNGSLHLYIVSADGSGLRQLTFGSTANDQTPAWSPDGTEIAFVRPVGGDDQVFLVPPTGGEPRQVTHTQGASGTGVSWSPDGSRIVYSCGRQLCVASADGTDVTQITDIVDTSTGAQDPQWSPDGTTIAFSMITQPAFRASIWTVSPSGEDLKKVADTGTDWGYPSWQPLRAATSTTSPG